MENDLKWLQQLRISSPAFIALAAYVILGITVLLPFEYPTVDENNEVWIVPYDLGQRLITVLLMTIPVALSIYSINCMMVGKCNVLSYIISLVTVLWVAIFVVMAFMYTFRA